MSLACRGLRGVAGLALAAALRGLRNWLASEAEEQALKGRPDVEYQAILDWYPVSKYYFDWEHNSSKRYGAPKAERAPRLLRLFDWRIRVRGMPEQDLMLHDHEGTDARTVLSGVDSLFQVILASRQWTTGRTDRVLVLAGMAGLTWPTVGETQEVREAVMKELRRLFGRVYTVGNDAAHAGFLTMPLGLSESKVRRTGADNVVAAIAAAGVDEAAKPFVLLSAFGAMTENHDTSGGPLKDFNPVACTNTSAAILAYSALPFYGAIRTSHIRRMHQAGQVPKVISRYMAIKWLGSNASAETGVVATEFPKWTWWRELSRFRFILSPMGDEIQTPKSVEALLVLTIPIIQRGPYKVAGDLLGFGFPIVVLDEWDEITPGNLSRWWQSLSPRLLSFRANCLTTDAFWRIVTGEITSCH